MIAVGRAGCGIDEAFDAGIFCRDQHVEVTVDIGLIGADRIFDGAWHRAQRSLVQHVVDAFAGAAAGARVADIAFDEKVARVVADRIEVGGVAGVGEFVEVDDFSDGGIRCGGFGSEEEMDEAWEVSDPSS